MAIPRNLSNLAQGADTSGVLGTSKGGTGLSTVGTNGQVLQSNGTSLVYATPSAGAMSLISTQTITGNVAFVEFKQLSGYSIYFAVFKSLKFSSGTTNGFQFVLGIGGSSPTYYTTGYTYNNFRGSAGNVDSTGAENQATAELNIGASAYNYFSGNMYLYGFSNSVGSYIHYTGILTADSNKTVSTITGGRATTSSPITAIKFSPFSSNFNGGEISLYGIT